MSKRNNNRKGFTLMELLVVIALVALLVTVMVPVILGFMRGRGLSMAGNNIGGFFAAARTAAMNTRQDHVIVAFEEEVVEDSGGSVEQGNLYVGPGLALYRINPNPTTDGEEVVNYVRQLNFSSGIGGNVTFSEEWKRDAPRGPILDIPDAANSRFSGQYKILVRPDGRLQIPEDKPGYSIDAGEIKMLDTDLALTDGDNYVFLDINSATGAVKRSTVISQDELIGG